MKHSYRDPMEPFYVGLLMVAMCVASGCVSLGLLGWLGLSIAEWLGLPGTLLSLRGAAEAPGLIEAGFTVTVFMAVGAAVAMYANSLFTTAYTVGNYVRNIRRVERSSQAV